MSTRFDGGRGITLAQGFRLVVRFASAIALTRLLTPAAYGFHGMAAAVFGFLYIARDLGIVTALQQPDMTPQRFNALCQIGFVGGLALAAIGALLGAPTGWFFGETKVVPLVLAAMSTSFVFSGAAAPAIGVLYREHRAGLAAAIEAVAMAVGSGLAVVAAWAGWGVWALVVLSVTQEIVFCVLAWRACPWRPGRDAGRPPWAAIVGFGANLTGHNIATYARSILDQVTVGRTAGAAALGLYGRGVQIPALPAQLGLGPFTPWIVAQLGRLRQANEDQVRFFRQALNSLLHVSFAAAVVCVVEPGVALATLFGPQWLPAQPVVRWLGIALAVQPWLMAPVWLLSAAGEVRRLLQYSFCGLVFMLVGCAFAYRHGTTAIALATAVAALLQGLLAPAFCSSLTPARSEDWIVPGIRPALVHGGLAAAWFGANALGTTALLLPVRIAVLLGIALFYYGAVILASSRLRTEIRGHLFWSR